MSYKASNVDFTVQFKNLWISGATIPYELSEYEFAMSWGEQTVPVRPN